MPTTIGIDPDLHDMAIASWTPDGPGPVLVVHVTGKTGQDAVVEMVQHLRFKTLHGLNMKLGHVPDRVAVEGQQLVKGVKGGKRPMDIVRLGCVAGAALMFARMAWPTARLYFPTPHEWKKSVPKYAHQARLYEDLGWGYEIIGKRYSRPRNVPKQFQHVTKGQWAHVGDAILLAKWAYEQRR